MMDDAHAALAEATDYFREGALTDALTLVEALLGASPDWPEALLLRGKVLFETGRRIEAAHTLRRVVDLVPEDAEGFYALGLTFRHLRKLEDAEGCLKACLRRNPDDHDARFVLANVLFSRQNLDEALAEYEVLATHRPNDADLWFNLARAADDRGRGETAVAAYRRFLALTPAVPDSVRQRTLAEGRVAAWSTGAAEPLRWDPEH